MHGTRVLLVEDNKFSRDYAKLVLESVGVSVVSAEHGRQALLCLEQTVEPFDVVLMDLNLPEMDGLEATQRLRKRFACLPVVALTSGSMASATHCRQVGFSWYLQKPVSKEQLVDTVAKAAAQRRSNALSNFPLWCLVEEGALSQPEVEALERAHSNTVIVACTSALQHTNHDLDDFDLVFVLQADDAASIYAERGRSRSATELSGVSSGNLIGSGVGGNRSETSANHNGGHSVQGGRALLVVPASKTPRGIPEFADLVIKAQEHRGISSVGALVCSREGVISDVNRKLVEMVGARDAQQLKGKSIVSLFLSFSSGSFGVNAEKLLAPLLAADGGESKFVNCVMRTKSRGAVAVRVSVASVACVTTGWGLKLLIDESRVGGNIVTVECDEQDDRIQSLSGQSRRVFGDNANNVLGMSLRQFITFEQGDFVHLANRNSCWRSISHVDHGGQQQRQRFVSFIPVSEIFSAWLRYEVRALDVHASAVHVAEGVVSECSDELLVLMGETQLVGRSIASLFLEGRIPEDGDTVTLLTTRSHQVEVSVQRVGEDVLQLSTVPTARLRVQETYSAGNYALGKVLGRGALGDVYRGCHKFCGDAVVVKSLHRKHFKDFNMPFPPLEFEVLSKVDHPNICALREYLSVGDRLLLVQDFVSNGSLLKYCQDSGWRGVGEAVTREFLVDIVSGVRYLHGLGYVHRDLKLDNCLVNNNWRIQIIDLGLAAKIPDDGSLLSTFAGTPEYSAPEVVQRMPYDGRAADVWSLGVIIFALMTGKFPFVSSNDTMTANYRWPPTVTASPALEKFVAKIFKVVPTERIKIDAMMDEEWFQEAKKKE